MRICLLCADLSRNAFGRAYVLASVLARSHDVQVVGPQFGPSVWPPMAGLMEREGIRLTAIPARHYPSFLASARRIWRAIDADLVYALKPYPTSFGLGLRYSRARDARLMLDIDDWELGIFQAMSWRTLLRTMLAGIASPNNYIWLAQMYRQTARADAVTVASTFLQRRYGGVLVPHGRDTATMDPTRVSGEAVRAEWGLGGKRVVLFLGTLRPHKGLEDLVAAMHDLGRPDAHCVIVGAEGRDPYAAQLRALADERTRLLPAQRFDRIPAIIAAADVVVIPQRKTPFAEAQVPAKLFDAMAMGRPIVATAISDMPQILDGCGLVVPPGDVSALGAAIAHLLDHPEEARHWGRAARERCVLEYSWEAMDGLLQSVIRNVLEGRCPPGSKGTGS